MDNKNIYKILFRNQDKIYEIYADEIRQSEIFGFVEVSKINFSERSSMLVDPVEESLRAEFQGVTSTHLPMHTIIRIDEVEKSGQSKILEVTRDGKNIAPVPIYTPTHGSSDK